MKISGIYKIQIEDIVYFGRSKDLSERRLEHIRLLKNNKHHNYNLQYAYNRYRSFSFEILEESISNLEERENWYIKSFPCCNIADGCAGGDTLSNHPRRDTIRQKISNRQKDAWANPSPARKRELEKRKTIDYALSQSKGVLIHTPYGIFPSLRQIRENTPARDSVCLNKWLAGVIVTNRMIGNQKYNHFKPEDVGKNTNDIGWYYITK